MSGKSRLSAGKPRVWSDHHTWEGQAYHREWRALEEEYGPLTSAAVREAASRTAVRKVRWLVALRALQAVEHARAHGEGRRPSVRNVESARRREGLEDGSYASARAELRELAGRRKPLDLAQRLTQGQR